MSKAKLAKAASLIMIITLISKIIGFLRDSLIASSFGATYQTDAYNMAITIPEILFAIFSLAITTTFIPVLSESYNKNGKEDMFDFFNNIMNIIVIIGVFLSVLGWIYSPQLVRVIAPKFRGETYSLTVTLVRISIVNIVFMCLNGGYTALLQTFDDFFSPAIVGIMLNLPIIIYILMGAKSGVIGLTIATVIGNVLKVLIQLPWLFKHGYRFKLFVDFSDKRISKILRLILPVVLGAGVNQLNAIIDKTIGSGLPHGSISALNFASRITDVVYVTFATAVVTVVYPALSREGNSNNIDEFKSYIVKAVNNISLIMIPCTVGLIVLSVPIVTILFKRGIFDDRAVSMTSIALIYFSVGMPFYGVRDVFNRGLYALKDTKTSTVNGIIGVSINIVLNLTLVRIMGLGGLAISTSIAAMITMFLLFISLTKKVGKFNKKDIVVPSLKIFAASLIMGVFVYFICNLFVTLFTGFKGILLGFSLSIIVGVAVYSFALWFLKVEEFKVVLNQFARKFMG